LLLRKRTLIAVKHVETAEFSERCHRAVLRSFTNLADVPFDQGVIHTYFCCDGRAFTSEAFQALDSSKIDLSEYYAAGRSIGTDRRPHNPCPACNGQ